MSGLSAAAVVPPEVVLMMNNADGPQMPPPEQWNSEDGYGVAIPDLTDFQYPALWSYGTEIAYSVDGEHYSALSNVCLTTGSCAVGQGKLFLLPKSKGFLKIFPQESSSYHGFYNAMIFDLPEADIDKPGVGSSVTLDFEAIEGIKRGNYFELDWDEDGYVPDNFGTIRCDLGNNKGNIIHFYTGGIDFNNADLSLTITDADGRVNKAGIYGQDENYYAYVPEGSKAMELKMSHEYSYECYLTVNLLTYAGPGGKKPSSDYYAATYFTGTSDYGRHVYREHFYDFAGDGSFSFVADRGSDVPVLTTLFPDGKIYGLDNRGHRLIRYNGSDYEALVEEKYSSVKSLVPFDYNNDGRFDFKFGDDVYTVDNAGNLNLDALTLLNPAQYEGLRSELKLSTGGEGVPGMGDMFGRDGAGAATGGVGTFADFNADGITDVMVYMNNSDSYHVDEANTLFLNTGKDRTLVYMSAPQVELIRDFDGDGLVDMVVKESDGLKIYLQRRGQASQVINAYRGFSGNVLGARDVDNDGDIDLIVSANSGSDYYVAVIENLGNGKFAKHENFLVNAGRYDFEINNILDVDADGKYEIVFKNRKDSNLLCSAKIESATEIGEIKEIHSYASGEPSEWTKTVIPIKNDGRMAYPVKKIEGFLYWATDPSWGVNSRPERPEAPTLTYDRANRRLCVSWPAGRDTETPTADLTYELRVGTSEGAADIVAANALADGTRRNIADGSNGFVREKVYDVSNWPAGKIYVSYQVVDGGWRGSEFSPAAVFENDLPAVAIAMTADKPGAGSAFNVWVENGPVAGSTYEWTCSDGGTFDIVDADRQTVAFTFATPGEKIIRLTVTDLQGRTATAIRKVDVNPQVIAVHDNTIGAANAFDLDGDGILELNTINGIYIQKTDGTFERYRRMFNSEGHSGITFDYNRDGLPDITGRDVLLNMGDGDMEVLKGVSTIECELDLNNDGIADSKSEINSGDYKTVYPISGGIVAKGFYYDYNGDGLIDNIYNEWDSQNGVYRIKYARNIDGYTFAEAIELMTSDMKLQNVADIDGDGTMDMIFSNYSYGFGVTTYSEFITVCWGNGSAPTQIQCPDGRPFGEIALIEDLDNNGVLDIVVRLQTEAAPAYPDCTAVYVYADHTYMNHSERAGTNSRPFINSDGNWRAYHGEFVLSAPNRLPEPPTGLRAAQSAKNVVIEWNAGSDAETPASALRYNISIKHKGAEGDNAYLISPMNGDNDQAPLPMPIRLLTSTRFTIPIASIPAGDYEIKLQSVDTHMGASRFSETLLFTVAEGAFLGIPTTVMLGETVDVRVQSNNNSDIDFGEGAEATVKASDSRFTDYSVVWRSEGLKEIKAAGKVIAGTMVMAAPDASFTLPEKVLAGATVRIPGAAEGKWELSADNGNIWNPVGSVSHIATRVDGNDYIIVFDRPGSYSLRRTVTRSQGDGVAQAAVSVVDEGRPEISLVSCSGDSHFKLEWNSAAIPEEVTAVRIYRETESYGVFAFADEVAPSAGAYTDLLSNAVVTPSRYRISWSLSYGESMPSVEHQPIHVQINKGMGEAVNLMWSHYQGVSVQSYRILRGTSPDNLEILATVSGNIGSYTDVQPGGVRYYAVETVAGAPAAASGLRDIRSEHGGARSNVVCTSDARDMTLAQSITIISPTGTDVLYMASEHNTLTAAVMPAVAGVSRANWEIVDGADKASIDAYGRLTYFGPGTISVKATACDGSGVSVTQQFEIRYSEVLAKEIEFVGGNMRTIKIGEQIRIGYTVLPKGAYQQVEWSAPYDDVYNPVLSVTSDGVITGLREGSELVRATCIDGSGWFDSVNIFVEALSGVENVSDLTSNVSVYTMADQIVVAGASEGSLIRIYTSDGSLIALADADGAETRFPLQPGFYIVCTDGQSFKIKL